jgi:Glycosyl transferases group 1
LLLVGPVLEPEYCERMRARITQLGVGKHVLFWGEVANPYPLLAISDIMTFTSRLEGFGTVVVEAMAHALPVVVRHLPGVNDYFISQEVTGFYFDSDEKFKEIVAALIKDPGRRERVGAAARRNVIEHFRMGLVARQFLELYGALSHEDHQPSPAEIAIEPLPAEARVTSADHVAAALTGLGDQPVLLTFLDAEESFDWSQPLSRGSADVSAMSMVTRPQYIFDRYGVVPLYLVDYPVASKPDGYRPLLELLADGKCDIGTQLHAWVSPPHLEEINSPNSYAGNLPLWLQFEKTRMLTDTIRRNFDRQPFVYRSGRYGVGLRTGDILKKLGYLVDTSVVPNQGYREQGGPEFYDHGCAPYWIDPARSLLEIPLSSSFTGLLSRFGPSLARNLFGPAAHHVHLPGAMARAGLLERIRLTPEGTSIADAKRLVRAMLADGHRVFMVTYHTPSLQPGNTPYVQNPGDLAVFLAWLDQFYDFFTSEIGGRVTQWRDVYKAAEQGRSTAASTMAATT